MATNYISDQLKMISEETGFDRGDRFTSEQQARDYFTVDSMVDTMSGCVLTITGRGKPFKVAYFSGWFSPEDRVKPIEWLDSIAEDPDHAYLTDSELLAYADIVIREKAHCDF